MHDPKNDVLIVGGGLSGLTSAVALGDHGYRVRLLEANRNLGGRAASFTDEKTGLSLPIGPHILLNLYPNLFKFFDRIGTRHHIRWQTGNRFITIIEMQKQMVIRGSILPAPLTFTPSLLPIDDISLKDLYSNIAAVHLALKLDEETVERLDSLTALELLRKLGVTEEFIQWFWAFICLAIMNVPLEKCSAGALMRFYKHLVGHNKLEVGFTNCGLGESYAPAAKDLIEKQGGSVRLQSRVKKVLVEDNRVQGVELTTGEIIHASCVILALAPSQLVEVLPEELKHTDPFNRAAKFESVPYISVFLWFDQKLTQLQFWARKFKPADLNCDFYDLANIYTELKDHPSVITSNIIGSERVEAMSDDEIIRTTLTELSEFLPNALTANLVHARVSRIPMAIHAPTPGSERLRPLPVTPIAGLYLTGDWIRTQLPSSMESACAAGWFVAEEILKQTEQAVTLVQPLPKLSASARFFSQFGRWHNHSTHLNKTYT